MITVRNILYFDKAKAKNFFVSITTLKSFIFFTATHDSTIEMECAVVFLRKQRLRTCDKVSHFLYIACLVCTCFICTGRTNNLCSFHKVLIQVFALSYYHRRLPTVKIISTSNLFSAITIFHLVLFFIFTPFINFSHLLIINPYPTAFPYGNGMVLHFYQQQESSTTKTVHKVINKGLQTYV